MSGGCLVPRGHAHRRGVDLRAERRRTRRGLRRHAPTDYRRTHRESTPGLRAVGAGHRRGPAQGDRRKPVHHEAAADQRAVLRAALRSPVAGPPLRERVRPGQIVAISACDGTRPQPRHLMIPAVLDELDGIVRPEDIVILVATGTHRGNRRPSCARCSATRSSTAYASSTTTPATSVS
ncbi:lactate racemase domain-containing protein [Streptomyces sp. B21-083]